MYHQHTLQPSNAFFTNLFKGVARAAKGVAGGVAKKTIRNTNMGGLTGKGKKKIKEQRKKINNLVQNKIAKKIANKTQGNKTIPMGTVVTPGEKTQGNNTIPMGTVVTSNTLNNILITLQKIQSLLQTDTKIAKYILVKNVNFSKKR